VALARAVAVEPRVLLLDEPLTALDAKLREAVRSDLNRLLRSLGITAVYVTHDQGEAMALGDRIVVMERGRIAQIGTPQEIYYHPANAFVADFVGAMNRVQGVVTGGRLQTPAGSLALFDQVAEGELASAMFRPEDVRVIDAQAGIAPTPARADVAGLLNGRVASSFFMGDRTRLEIDIGAAQPLIAETARRGSWQGGQEVALEVPLSALVRLPATKEAV